MNRDALLEYLANFLAINTFEDYVPNGLQIEGKSNIHCLATAVSASAQVIEQAVEGGADALLVHHGFFWKGEHPCITGGKYRRVRPLIKNDINLIAYHLPLDQHAQLGNNAAIGEVFPLQSRHTSEQQPLLWHGVLQTPMQPTDVVQLVRLNINQHCRWIKVGSHLIRRIAWCSGAAHDFLPLAAQEGAELYLSGEAAERSYHQARECGIHYIAAGHHCTETFGVRRLGDYLARSFNLSHFFINEDNPF